MLYVGLDVGGKVMAACVVDGKKKRVLETEVPSTRAGLKALLKKLAGPKVVAFEAGNELRWVHEVLKKADDVTIHVVHPNAVKLIVNSNGKTDKVDARKLAELARIDGLPPKVHVVEGETAELRVLVGTRSNVVRQATMLKNTLRGHLRQEGIKLGEKFFSRKDWAAEVKRLSTTPLLKALAEALVPLIEATENAELLLRGNLEAIADRRTALLETVPGIAKINSRVLVGALDEAGRFKSRKKVAKYGALAPTVRQSGTMLQVGRINVDGRREVRQAMLQSAHSVARQKNADARPLREFYERLKKRQGGKKAMVALARKLLTVAWAVLRTDTPYTPALVGTT